MGTLIIHFKNNLFKTLISVLLFQFFCVFSYGQVYKLENLDINLENYTYPFSVSFLEINNQNQPMKMAYMDVKPATPKW